VGHAEDYVSTGGGRSGLASFAEEALSFLGLGRIPLVLVLCCFCLVWGVAGLVSNQFLSKVLRTEWLYVWPSLASAIVCSTFATHSMSKVLARVVPKSETYALGRAALVGMVGKTLYSVTPSSGAAHVRTPNGLCQVYCRVDDGKATIETGKNVILVDYDADSGSYSVAETELDA